jgi:hypothetical protein
MAQPFDLTARLREAASSADWTRDVAHECAWCADPATHATPLTLRVISHGMCAACATRALATIAARRRAA